MNLVLKMTKPLKCETFEWLLSENIASQLIR